MYQKPVQNDLTICRWVLKLGFIYFALLGARRSEGLQATSESRHDTYRESGLVGDYATWLELTTNMLLAYLDRAVGGWRAPLTRVRLRSGRRLKPLISELIKVEANSIGQGRLTPEGVKTASQRAFPHFPFPCRTKPAKTDRFTVCLITKFFGCSTEITQSESQRLSGIACASRNCHSLTLPRASTQRPS